MQIERNSLDLLSERIEALLASSKRIEERVAAQCAQNQKYTEKQEMKKGTVVKVDFRSKIQNL